MVLTNRFYGMVAGILGAFCLLTAVATIPIFDEVTFWFYFWGVFAVSGLGLFLRFYYRSVKESVGSRQALLALCFSLLIAGFFGCVILVNLIAGKRYYSLDLTETELFKLSDGAKMFLDKMSEDVTVSCFIPPQISAGNLSLSKFVEEQLGQMSERNPKLHYNMYNPAALPPQLTEFGLEEVFKTDAEEVVLVIEKGYKRRELFLSKDSGKDAKKGDETPVGPVDKAKDEDASRDRVALYRQDLLSEQFKMDKMESRPVLLVESALIGGIRRLFGTQRLAVYQRMPKAEKSMVLVGNQERPLDTLLNSLVAEQPKDELTLNQARRTLFASGIDVMATPRIWKFQKPEILLLAGLDTPLSDEEIEEARALAREGCGFVIFQGVMPRTYRPDVIDSINRLLEPFRARLEKAILREDAQYWGYPEFPLVLLYPNHPITRWIGRTVYPYSCPVEGDPDLDPLGRIRQTRFLETTPGTEIVRPGAAPERLGRTACLGLAVELDHDFEKSSRVVIVGSNEFYKDIHWSSGASPFRTPTGNYQLLVSAIEWAGHRPREFPAGIKDVTTDRAMPSPEHRRILIYIFMLAYPLFFLSLGIWVYYKRGRG